MLNQLTLTFDPQRGETGCKKRPGFLAGGLGRINDSGKLERSVKKAAVHLNTVNIFQSGEAKPNRISIHTKSNDDREIQRSNNNLEVNFWLQQIHLIDKVYYYRNSDCNKQ